MVGSSIPQQPEPQHAGEVGREDGEPPLRHTEALGSGREGGWREGKGGGEKRHPCCRKTAAVKCGLVRTWAGEREEACSWASS